MHVNNKKVSHTQMETQCQAFWGIVNIELVSKMIYNYIIYNLK
jgi:hypothetical protein